MRRRLNVPIEIVRLVLGVVVALILVMMIGLLFTSLLIIPVAIAFGAYEFGYNKGVAEGRRLEQDRIHQPANQS